MMYLARTVKGTAPVMNSLRGLEGTPYWTISDFVIVVVVVVNFYFKRPKSANSNSKLQNGSYSPTAAEISYRKNCLNLILNSPELQKAPSGVKKCLLKIFSF